MLGVCTSLFIGSLGWMYLSIDHSELKSTNIYNMDYMVCSLLNVA
jgi:hypothetical protein